MPSRILLNIKGYEPIEKDDRSFLSFSYLWTLASDPAAGNTQKRNWSGCGCHNRTYNMYVSGSGWRKHASIQDLPTHCCYYWRVAFPLLFVVFLFLSSPMIVMLWPNPIPNSLHSINNPHQKFSIFLVFILVLMFLVYSKQSTM